ncbi:Uncharacterised protein [Mobiluncus mulieris]|nr:Uncharacterised protein [Mobiluncus mulieris]
MDLGLEADQELRGQTLSRVHWLLWRVLQDAYRAVGFDEAIGDAAFEQLVLASLSSFLCKWGLVCYIVGNLSG